MKNMKKIVSLFLALLMILAMAMTALADNTTTPTTGTITVTNAVSEQTYSIYKILDLESYEADVAYAYKAATGWGDFLNRDGIKNVYVTIDNSGYVHWVEGADAADFAQEAIDWAKGKNQNNTVRINPLESEKATNTTVTFDELGFGYYLIDSSLGTLCALDTTDPTVNVEEKNTKPEVKKEVKEGTDYGKVNDTDIGNTVQYKAIITTAKGAENYVFHDKMEPGLTFDQTSVRVQVINSNDTEEDVPNGTYQLITDKTIIDQCTFEIKFEDSYMQTLGRDGKRVIIYYNAILNEKASVGVGDGNVNEAWLSYGDENKTTHDTTTTYTYAFDLVKTNRESKLIDGAEFKLYNNETDIESGNPFKFVKDADGNYRAATDAEITAGNTVDTIVVTDGKVTVSGLDGSNGYGSDGKLSTNGWIYWLVETKAPNGYNKLSAPQEIVLKNTNNLATIEVNTNTHTEGGFKIVNQTGAEFPSTGGMGTTIFYVVGAILVVGAAVLLLTKQRMNKE